MKTFRVVIAVAATGDAVDRGDMYHWVTEHCEFLNTQASGLDATAVKFTPVEVEEII